MNRKYFLLGLLFLLAAGVYGQFHTLNFFWNGRAVIMPFKQNDVREGTVTMQAYFPWLRFGVTGISGTRTVGIDAYIDTYMQMTNDASIFVPHTNQWGVTDSTYSMWFLPFNFWKVTVGKWIYNEEDRKMALNFFERVGSPNSIAANLGMAANEFYAGFDNYYNEYHQAIPIGALFEFPLRSLDIPLTVNLNFKGIDPSMRAVDYFKTIQIGVNYEINNFGLLRAQMIGFDPDGIIDSDNRGTTYNYNRVDFATSQFQAAVNITALPWLDVRLAFHWHISKSGTQWGTDLKWAKNAVTVPLAFSMDFGKLAGIPLSVKAMGTMQFGKPDEQDWRGNDIDRLITNFKIGGEVKYNIQPNKFDILADIAAYNIGRQIVLYDYLWVKPLYDIAAGVQYTLRDIRMQAGFIVSIDTAENGTTGFSIPFTVEFGF